MAAAVEFNAKKLFKYLNPLEASQLRYAGNIALKRIGFSLAKKEIPDDMERYFDRPVPFTKRSVNYTVQNDTLTLRVNRDDSKGNAPSKYLFPVTAAGVKNIGGSSSVYPTRFPNWLWDKDYINRSQFPIPYTNNAKDVTVNRYGNVNAAVYQRTQVALSRTKGTVGVTSRKLRSTGIAADRAFVIRGDENSRKTAHLTPGIYRVKTGSGTNELRLLFTLRGTPSVPVVFPYQDNVFSYARINFQKELRKQIQEAIAKTPV